MQTFIHIQVFPGHGRRFSLSFEEFASAVQDWPSMYFEMDGSFVWSLRSLANSRDVPGDGERDAGQIDGMVYDRDGRIEYVELKGCGPIEAWHKLFRAIEPKCDAIENRDSMEIVDCKTSARYSLARWP